ncbi:DJ-1/PfpI family protein [Rhizobium sp. 16-449-1b]|uniref:DJ-1/PfpI family protein n=1 Tax=Rhizobium sp. 16-449-1b TaxID=2819989 RepID=UPI001ADC7285|nr:DJ-1/PfpI family protein [Rhizobium sp. 16-449-1b]MBO9195928.1 DJ-1/PfpI family protein [Rhizobium sp. 16-449-1b]
MTKEIDRRTLLAISTLLATGAAFPAAADDKPTGDPRGAIMEIPPDAPKVAMLIHPKMVAIDLIGPMSVFNIMRFNVQLVWKDKTPVTTELGIPIQATHTFEECPSDLDVLFVAGGLMGTIDCMNDPDVLAFLADRGERAKWVTSVCTGGLLIGAAGLLKGYDATANWTVTDLLPLLGARHVDKRVVRDRNRMTGAGATAGLDFALELSAEMKGEEAARRVQLILEYAPAPPFSNGTPKQAGPQRVAEMRKRRTGMDRQARAAAELAGKRLGISRG